MDLADDVGQAIVAERRPARLYDLRAPSLWLGARALVAVGTWIRNRLQPVHPGPDLVNRPTPEWSAEWQGEIAGLGDPGAAPVRLRIRIGAARSLLEVVRRDRPLCTAAVAVEVVERHARIWTEGDIPCADGTRLSSLAFFWTGACIHIDQANYDGNVDYNGCGARTDVDRERTVAVGSLPPNPWGLHEVAGNVWEWVQDAWHDNYQGAPGDGSAWEDTEGRGRVLRGGGWYNLAGNCRSAARGGNEPADRIVYFGLRLSRGSSPPGRGR